MDFGLKKLGVFAVTNVLSCIYVLGHNIIHLLLLDMQILLILKCNYHADIAEAASSKVMRT